MTPTPAHVSTTLPAYVVLDVDLRGRPALAEAGDYQAGLPDLAAVQGEFYDQLDAYGEGGSQVRLALSLAPIDATGTNGSPCNWATIKGMRSIQR